MYFKLENYAVIVIRIKNKLINEQLINKKQELCEYIFSMNVNFLEIFYHIKLPMVYDLFCSVNLHKKRN